MDEMKKYKRKEAQRWKESDKERETGVSNRNKVEVWGRVGFPL